MLEQWCQQQRIDSPQTLQRWQQQQGLSPEQWQQFVARRWRWLLWCEQNLEAKLNSHYLERKSQLDQVSYSLLRVKDQHLANELHLRIKEGEASFEEIASEYSEGPERQQGGRLGPVPLSQPHPMLAKLLQVSTPGQLWPPKQLENWWIVVRLEELHCTELTDSLKQRLLFELGRSAPRRATLGCRNQRPGLDFEPCLASSHSPNSMVGRRSPASAKRCCSHCSSTLAKRCMIAITYRLVCC